MYHALALKIPHQNYFVIDIVFMHISMYNACLQIIVLSVAATPTKHQQTTKVFHDAGDSDGDIFDGNIVDGDIFDPGDIFNACDVFDASDIFDTN